MRWIRPLLLTLAALATMAATPLYGPPPEPGTAVWFGLHFIDTSTEGAIQGVRADETARIAMIEDFIADDLTARGFTLIEPPADKVAAIKNPVNSNHRDTRIAAGMGARYAISGEVQKVSNLILAVNLYVRDAQTGKNVRAGAVDIRGNNDESFRRGYSYLLRNIIFREE
ncbi:DUF3280 domain-containing protein [Paracoccus luteus]|uniref:DUF3280 domain-containing protein n=1 Tax=Paracoccus luteus TaxID=2508543 RepID=UPI00107054CF|nr:DUF3280 domain-containing protein [Paracoccus luteus]